MPKARVVIVLALAMAAMLTIGVVTARRLMSSSASGSGSSPSANLTPIPVEVAPVRIGTIERLRTFSGSLEPSAQATFAPKIAGRINSLPVDLADTVQRGQVVARLDDAELSQQVTQAQAELAVAQAELVEATNAAEIAQRELNRIQTLQDRGVASESNLDTARADHLSKSAGVQVAQARIRSAESALESARIRLGYTTLVADWEGGDDRRVVAARYADEGDTIAANTPLLSIIQLDPAQAVISVTERDYAQLAVGQEVTLSTDAHPGRAWTGQIARVAPRFAEGSRQARVEVLASNPEGALKPGMFVRVRAILGREERATIVPAQAITSRDGQEVVFVLSPDSSTVRMVPVTVGIREGERAQVTGPGVEGRVVVLGQQLLGDGAAVAVTPGPGDSGG